MDGRTRRGVAVLALCKSLQVVVTAATVAFAGLAGHAVAADKALATLPMTVILAAAGLVTAPASFLMARFGRRSGFLAGACAGAAGGLLAARAVVDGSLLLLCAGCALVGVFQAFAQYYRFAAAELAGPAGKSWAISLVVGGGLAAAFLGPLLASWSQAIAAPSVFVGPFLVVAAAAALTGLAAASLEIPRPSPASLAGGRGLGGLARDPAFRDAVLLSTVSYAVMSYLMSATPLAVVACGFGNGEAAISIQWHLLAMFAPSLATGYFLSTLGLRPVLLLGLVALLASAAVLGAGDSFANFVGGMVLLGFGWNLLYVGATTLLATRIPAADQPRAQAANELVVFGTAAATSGLAGGVFAAFGWTTVVATALLATLAAGAAIARRSPAPEGALGSRP